MVDVRSIESKCRIYDHIGRDSLKNKYAFGMCRIVLKEPYQISRNIKNGTEYIYC